MIFRVEIEVIKIEHKFVEAKDSWEAHQEAYRRFKLIGPGRRLTKVILHHDQKVKTKNGSGRHSHGA